MLRGPLFLLVLLLPPLHVLRAQDLKVPVPAERMPIPADCKTYGTEQWRLGNYATALECFAQAFEEDRAAGDLEGMAGDLNQIGLIKWRLNDCTSAMECYTESARLATLCGHERLLGLTHLNRSILLKNQDEMDSAIMHNGKALTIFTRIDAPKDLALALNNQGQIHKRLGEAEEAVANYRRSLALCRELGDTAGMATACFNLGNMHQRAGRIDSAFAYSWSSLRLALHEQGKVRISEALLQLSELHEAAGRPDSALTYYKAHKSWTDSLHLQDRSQALALLQAKLGGEVKDLHIRNLRSEQALHRARTWGLFIGLLALAAVVALIVHRRWIQVRARKRLLEVELSNTRRVLGVKEEELRDHIRAMAEKTVQIQRLQEELAVRLPAGQAGAPSTFHHDTEVAELLERKILTEDDWRAFKEKFSAIYPHFFARIKLLGLQLSEGEVRSMVLLRLGLAPKEMAELLGISPQSARVGKLRLKKKLQASGHDTVEDLLDRLTA